MNKSTKIWLNYTLGASLSALLLWGIYVQVKEHAGSAPVIAFTHSDSYAWIIACLLLMFANSSLEGYKWYLLTSSVAPIRYRKALASYFAGVAFAIVTPNRIGEYPGRVLHLSKTYAYRYITVSILGIAAQLWSVYLFGLAGLIYYNIAFPSALAKAAFAFCALVNVAAMLAYWRFGRLLPWLEKRPRLKKLVAYGRFLQKVARSLQLKILAISLTRFAIFTAQYLLLLRWMNVNIPPVEGFCMAAVFFWVIAVIPSIALTELGVRGNVCIYLFQQLDSNTIGMLTATTGLWLLNLIVPSVIGSILVLRMRLIK